jgi:hypothetical protein
MHADQTDTARSWTLDMLADCSAKVVLQYATAAPELLLEMDNTASPRVDQTLPQTLAERSRSLGRTTTLAGFLRHRRHALGLHIRAAIAGRRLPSPPPSKRCRGAH